MPNDILKDKLGGWPGGFNHNVTKETKDSKKNEKIPRGMTWWVGGKSTNSIYPGVSFPSNVIFSIFFMLSFHFDASWHIWWNSTETKNYTLIHEALTSRHL